MERFFKIASRVLIIGITLIIIYIPIVMLGNNLYKQGLLPDQEKCERCWGWIMSSCSKIEPCDIIDGRVGYYLFSVLIVVGISWLIIYLIEKKTNFDFENWISGK